MIALNGPQIWWRSIWLLATLTAVAASGFEGYTGAYCSTRPNGCCNGRLDDCSVSLSGTLCYCDNFCNRTRDDCCPDYWTHCLNIPPPAPLEERCFADGRYYNYGEKFNVKCNKCKCRNGLECEDNTCLVGEDVVSGVNSGRALGWTAFIYADYWDKILSDYLKYRTGTLEPHQTVKDMKPLSIHAKEPLPPSFDARSKWPSFIGEARNQEQCAASWVMSTVAMASDRFRIMSGGMESAELSPQHLLSCNNRQKMCEGGHLSRAWMFMRKFGLVSEACYPWTATASKCRLPLRTNLKSARCSDRRMNNELYKVGPAYRIKGEQDIMHEIMTSGPVQATMKVFQDFFFYKSGVYRKSTFGNSELFKYHSVRIIGWGEELGQRYWLAINSWGKQWGEEGLFRIVRGTNECNIEEFVLAAWSKTQKPMPFPFG